MIREPAIKRVYDPPAESDGMRVLVDRLRPRGLTKEKAKVDLWLKDISPSNALRKEFHGQADDWEEFRKAYFAELESDTARRPRRRCSSTCAPAPSRCFTAPATSSITMRSRCSHGSSGTPSRPLPIS